MKRAMGIFALAIAASCGNATHVEPPAEPRAEDTLATLRARFPGVLDRIDDGAPSQLHVALGDEIALVDPASGIGATIRSSRALGERTDVDGLAVFSRASVVVRLRSTGVEDFVAFERAPEREQMIYRLAPTGGAALRLVAGSQVIELVDASGAPRIRMSAPWILGADGAKRAASVAIEGCAYDASPAPPWGRPTTPPGSAECTLRIAWRDVVYPALLDPSWSITATMPTHRSQHVAVKLGNGRVLVTYGNSCDGSCGTYANGSGDVYDPVTKTFATSGSAGGKVIETPGVTLGNGKALVLSPPPGPAALYDGATGQFQDTGPSTINRAGGATLTVLANGKVLAAGGGASVSELYDPASNSFSLGPALKSNRSGHTATLLANGKVLLTGGGDATAELYDPTTNAFTLTGSMSVARTGHSAVRLASGKVLVAGGDAKAIELYDPVTGQFTVVASLPEPRPGLAAALMPSGNVYLVGGCPGGRATSVVERFDPQTNALSAAPFLERPRCHHRLTMLGGNVLLATGGRTRFDSNLTADVGEVEELGVAPAGGTCVLSDDCASGICDQGVCCLTACASACMSCVAGTGQCLPVKGADDPSSCTGEKTCDPSGACKQKNGRACTTGTDCASGSCADGVCCDRACDKTCEACDGPNPGTCAIVAGKPHGKRACASDGTLCGGACNGIDLECRYPQPDTGCGTSCADATRTARTCDGSGRCIAQEPKVCPGNFACADEASCRTSCTNDAECAHGYACAEGKCTPTASCDGDHTIVGADRKSKTDCSPYRCDMTTNRCLTACEDVEGCAEPYFCEASGQCVPRPRATSGCATPGTTPGAPAGVIAVAMLVLAGTIRRKRCR